MLWQFFPMLLLLRLLFDEVTTLGRRTDEGTRLVYGYGV